MSEHNDIQRHLLAKVRKAADDYRASLRPIATELVDAIIACQEAGSTREQIIDDLVNGMANGLR